MDHKTAVLMALQRHIGRGNGIKAEALAGKLDMPARHVRTLITELRLEGHAICGHPAEGYYLAATAEELEDTCDFLRGRALHSLSIEAALRKITLPELLGQMRLKS